MGVHQPISFTMTNGHRCYLVASIEGQETWAVAVEAILTPGGEPVLAGLSIYPRLQLALSSHRDAAVGQAGGPGHSPGRATDWAAGPWSGSAEDVPRGGIPARLLRSIKIGELVDLVRERALEGGHGASKFSPDFYLYSADTTYVVEVKRHGRKGNGIDHYLYWAVRYLEAIQAGSRHPIKTLAGESGATEPYLRDTIHDARRRHGLLSDPVPGRAGGELTAKALKLLEERKGREVQGAGSAP